MGEPANGGGEFGFVSSKNSVRGERETAVLERWKGFGDVAVALFGNAFVVHCLWSVVRGGGGVARIEAMPGVEY
jgi:hypothetical protein